MKSILLNPFLYKVGISYLSHNHNGWNKPEVKVVDIIEYEFGEWNVGQTNSIEFGTKNTRRFKTFALDKRSRVFCTKCPKRL